MTLSQAFLRWWKQLKNRHIHISDALEWNDDVIVQHCDLFWYEKKKHRKTFSTSVSCIWAPNDYSISIGLRAIHSGQFWTLSASLCASQSAHGNTVSWLIYPDSSVVNHHTTALTHPSLRRPSTRIWCTRRPAWPPRRAPTRGCTSGVCATTETSQTCRRRAGRPAECRGMFASSPNISSWLWCSTRPWWVVAWLRWLWWGFRVLVWLEWLFLTRVLLQEIVGKYVNCWKASIGTEQTCC